MSLIPRTFEEIMQYNVPPTDLYESNDAYKIEMALPGVTKDAIEVEADFEHMDIVVKLPEEEETEKKFLLRERTCGRKFLRQVSFKRHVDPQKAELQLHDGVLTIIVPKAPAAQKVKLQLN